MVIRKYSKSSEFYFSTKSDFFDNNEELLSVSLGTNKIYTSQEIRKNCKICNTKLDEDVDLESHGVLYKFCRECSHLNGIHEDTEEFVRKLYIDQGGENYNVSDYVDKNYSQRCNDIYFPKIDFLKSIISHDEELSILDVGCGSGYLVYSAIKNDINAVGLDVSKKLVCFGNNQINNLIGKKPLSYFEEESNFYNSIIETSSLVVSAIGVIEHLRKPELFFEAFKKSNAKYLYYSVPMFSLSSIIENCFSNSFPRQLSGGHTHLFTEQSIIKMNEIIGIQSIGEWRFGVDMLDLYRAMHLTLKENGSSKKLLDILQLNYTQAVDKMQNSLDESHFCSEIHLIGAKLS